MPLRTYPLIVHPAFIAFVEHQRGADHGLFGTKPVEVPTHRPAIKNIVDVADYLRISPLFIRSMLMRPGRHYRTFYFSKRDGSKRRIDSPRTFLKVVQWWILDTILYNSELPGSVHGFVPYKSFITNAKEHLGARHLLNVDIEDFFPSITLDRVASVFESCGYGDQAVQGLAGLVTYNGCLPQGAPTSPMIANLIMKSFDEFFVRYCEERGWTYTRYADDITVSSRTFIDSAVIDVIGIRLGALGLRLNAKKTHFMGPNCRKEVTGLLLGSGGVRLSPEYLNAARGWFRTVARDALRHTESLDRVRGTVSLIRSVGGAGSESVLKLGEEAILSISKALAIARALQV